MMTHFYSGITELPVVYDATCIVVKFSFSLCKLNTEKFLYIKMPLYFCAGFK